MRFDLKRPCKNCPFRKDVPGYLTQGRARQILNAIMREDASFTCHKTISGRPIPEDDPSESAYVPGEKDQHCAGALLMQRRAGWPNRLPRLAVFMKLLDPDELKGEELVFETEDAMIAHMERDHP